MMGADVPDRNRSNSERAGVCARAHGCGARNHGLSDGSMGVPPAVLAGDVVARNRLDRRGRAATTASKNFLRGCRPPKLPAAQRTHAEAEDRLREC